MSRSCKKNMGSTICCCKNIKDDRTVYHRIERAKSRRQLKKVKIDPENDKVLDEINKEKIDYDVKWADPWSWSSDGGSMLMETEASLSNDFIKVLNDSELFEVYYLVKTKEFPYYWPIRLGMPNQLEHFICKLSPENLTEDKLVEWISSNRTRILQAYKKVTYGK